MALRAEAFAKTNRSLRVRGKRADGFHELDTVFQSIDLTDEIEVEESGRIELVTDDPRLPVGRDNLVVRAAEMLAGFCGTSRGARIRLTKRIPIGAGLGGGSSDAAITLGLLARLWNLEHDRPPLETIAAKIGSDVAFFLIGGAARGTGRGEILTALADDPEERIVLVIPPFSISTAAVYSRWRHPEPDPSGKGYFGVNDLASAVLQTNSGMLHYLQTVSKSFPDCQISGSGSSIVALAPRGEDFGIESVREELPSATVLPVRTVARPEYRRRSGLDALDRQQEVDEP